MNERQLIIMRHAHAQPPAGLGGDDHARPLTPAGQLAARGRRTLLLGMHVQLVLCSTATRTRQTLAELDLDTEAELLDELYRGGLEDYRQVITRIDDSVERVLLIAHQPTVEQLALWLAGRAAPVGRFEPASLAVIDVEVPWAALAGGDGVLAAFHG